RQRDLIRGQWNGPTGLKTASNEPVCDCKRIQINRRDQVNTITLVAIDLAKSSFHIHAVTESGRRVTSKAVRRKHLFETVVKLAPKYVAFEACGSSHYWAQRFIAEGF